MDKTTNKTKNCIDTNSNTTKYRTILADPPWSINQRGKKSNRSAESHYPLMSLEQIKAMPISDLAAENAHLYLGNYLRNASETCMFATRGKAPVKFHGQANWMFCPVQEHSHKPEEQFPIIEILSHPPYLELFARRRPSNPEWDVWGNQIDSDIVIPGYPVPEYSAKARQDIYADTAAEDSASLEEV